MGRGEAWTTTVSKALAAVGGEASETEILRWVQDNRPSLQFGWPAEVRSALLSNGDGHGKGLFESISGREGMWRLVAWTKTSTEPVPPQYAVLHDIGRLMVKALRHQEAGLTALEHYLLAIGAYELEWYRDAMSLLDTALADGLDSEYYKKAEELRQICALKTED